MTDRSAARSHESFAPAPGWELTGTLPTGLTTAKGVAWSQDNQFIAVPDEHRIALIDPSGTSKRRLLRFSDAIISRLAWAPDQSRLAIAYQHESFTESITDVLNEAPIDIDAILGTYAENVNTTDGETNQYDVEGPTYGIRIVDADALEVIAELGGGTLSSTITGLAWSPDGRRLVTTDIGGVFLWDARSTELLNLTDVDSYAQACAFNPSGRHVATAHGDGLVFIWSAQRGERSARYQGNESGYMACCWLSDQALALGAYDGTVEIWESTESGTFTNVASVQQLEGQAAAVDGVSISPDGLILAVHSQDGSLHLWSTADWTRVAEYKDPHSASWGLGIAESIQFSSGGSLIVTGAAGGIQLWSLDTQRLLADATPARTTHYCNAKVVLVGDSGVGKSGLGLVLAGDEFRPTESTHQRNVFLLSTGIADTDIGPEMREVYLWDLAGQPGYRILHQLQLGDVAVAVVVFDARNEMDPFAGVRHWVRALRQAQFARELDTPAARALLVTARTDRGGPKISNEQVEAIIKEGGFDGYFETSAKAGWGIEELETAIIETIDWKALPRVSSTELFDSIKSFLVEERERAGVLATQDELERAYLRLDAEADSSLGPADLRLQFSACIGRVASRGLIRRLSFGNLVLLQPEVLDSYAAALANAARDEPDGLGTVSEEHARNGDFRMSAAERLDNAETERLLRIAAIEDLLKHEIALREHSADGPYLVFPGQTRREMPTRASLPLGRAVIAFDGPVQHVYVTLVVRLSHSGVFRRAQVWRNSATFTSAGSTCGVVATETQEGHGEIVLFLEDGAVTDGFQQFQEFVLRHIRRRAIPDSVMLTPIVTCDECNCELTQQQVDAALARGKTFTTCPVCDTPVVLRDGAKEESEVEKDVAAMSSAANAGTLRAAAVSTLQGKIEVADFDVFLAHNSQDRSEVKGLAGELRKLGINPWLDIEQIPPGRWFQDVIQQAVPNVRSAAIILGRSGIGQWQAVELRAFVAECAERGLPVIPVILPGGRVPEGLLILRQLRVVEFAHSITERGPLNDLRWGITGVKT